MSVAHRVTEARPLAEPLHVETITEERALRDLEPIWNELLDASDPGHPFLTHEWIRTWWECFGAGHELRLLLVSDGGRPVALCPLMLTRGRLYGAPVRRLEIIGNVHTQRFDLIVVARDADVYRALWDAIRLQRSHWDILVLSHLPAGSQTLLWFSWLARRDRFLIGRWGSRSPYLRLDGDWPAYSAGLSRKHRANLRRRSRRLERLGPLEVEEVRSGPKLAEALRDGFRLEAAGWKGLAGTAITDDEATLRFYTLLAERAARRGWLRLHFLKAGGRRIAFDFSLFYANKAFVLKPAFDPAFASCSPYSQLLARVLQDHFEKGVEEFDFLGRDDPWKHDWANQSRPHEWLFVMPDEPAMRALHFLKFRVIPNLQRYSAYRVLRDAASAAVARVQAVGRRS